MRDLVLALTSLQTFFRENGLQWLAVEVNPDAVRTPEQARTRINNVKNLLMLRRPSVKLMTGITAGIKRVEVTIDSI